MAPVDLPATLRRIQQVKLLPLFLALAFCVVVQASPATPTPSPTRSSISSVHIDGPYIAMTFDDGPRPDSKNAFYTPKLLDILKERHIHATFFVIGQMVKAHPEILKREIAEGHEVGNHTWDH